MLAVSALATTVFAQDSGEALLPAESIPWAVEAPGQPQRLGKLWGERSTGPAGTLLKVPGGFVAPIHSHTADYRAVVVEGAWKHWFDENAEGAAVELRPGSYWTQAADKWHGDACVSEIPCTILLINSEPYETVVR
jgi:quercetin dioxygenase-like cupin family protein